jgi:23S rRNA pseudouridine2605 synthase
LKLSVTRLIRLSFGPFSLGDLQPGQIEEVKRRVLADQIGGEVAAKLGVAHKRQDREKPAAGKAGAGKGEAKPRRPGDKPQQRRRSG